MIQITAKWAAKGTTGDVTTCEFCGKANLRKTVILVALDADGNPGGQPVHAGTSCAAQHLAVSAHRVRTVAATAQRRAEKIAERAAQMSPAAVAELAAEADRLALKICRAINVDRNPVQADFLKRQLAPITEILIATGRYVTL